MRQPPDGRPFLPAVFQRMMDLSLVLLLAACGGDAPTGPIGADDSPPTSSQASSPERVTDLSVESATDSSLTVTFIEVDDGTGQPAKYDVRYDRPDFSWGSASGTLEGSCAPPVKGTEIGATLMCTVEGLTPETAYELALVAFRETPDGDAVYGEISNVARDTTAPSDTTDTPPSDATAPFRVEDFSSYDDLDHFLEDPNDWYLGRRNTGQMAFDRSVTVRTEEKSLRYDFPENDDCSNYTITNELDVDPAATELWVEAWVRFSSNWHTTMLGCTSLAYDYKLLLGWTESSRFQLKMGKAGDLIVVSGPGGASSGLFLELSSPLATEYFDGRWHRYRMHWRVNGDDTGTVRQWIDGTLVAEATGAIDSGAESITHLMLGANRNHGMDEPMSLWFGPVSLWREDPGW